MTYERRLAIAKDYYKTDLTLRQIGEKHSIAPATVKNISNRIHEGNFAAPEYVLIKVESKWIEGIIQFLFDTGIQFEIPQKFELTEYYESKL